jgi:hypothetical protein
MSVKEGTVQVVSEVFLLGKNDPRNYTKLN